MRTLHYKLEGHEVVPCVDWPTERVDNRVALTERDGVAVSTVFLGIDHQYGGGPPLVFETMVFGGRFDEEQERCSTWAEAEAMHKVMCARVWGAR